MIYKTKVTLYRSVNKRIRYYRMYLAFTLFGECMLIKENGSLKNNSATRVVREYYATMSEALHVLQTKLQEKYKRGYSRVVTVEEE